MLVDAPFLSTMVGCPGPRINQLGGIEGFPSVRDIRLVCGVVGRFQEEESEGLLSVLHLWSD